MPNIKSTLNILVRARLAIGLCLFAASIIGSPSLVFAVLPADGGTTGSLCYASLDLKKASGNSIPLSCDSYVSGGGRATSTTVFKNTKGKPVGIPTTGCYLQTGNNPLTFTQGNCQTLDSQLTAWQNSHPVGGTNTQQISSLPKTSKDCVNATTANACLANNKIIKDVKLIINLLAGLVGIVAVGSFIFAGIQYTTAGDNTSAIQAAKKRIYRTVLALLAFLFSYAFIQWLVPGGLL